MACARDGNIGEAGVEQVWVDAGIAMNEDAFCSESLGAMTGDGVAVVKMTILAGVKFDLAAVATRAVTWPSGAIDSITARSRLATPSDLSGAAICATVQEFFDSSTRTLPLRHSPSTVHRQGALCSTAFQ
jgi:hypothetical protein